MEANNRLNAPRASNNRIPSLIVAAMSRERDALDTIEVDEQSTAPTKVLSTYGGIDTSTQNYFFHVRFVSRRLCCSKFIS